MPISVDLTEGVADWWMLGATLGAAVATAASAVVVAVQAVQTSRSTKAAVRAAEASERNADAAVRAAELSERMYAQSERERRDAALPKVTFHAAEWSDAPVFRRSWLVGTRWDYLEEGFRVAFSGDDAYPTMFDDIGMRVPVTLINDGVESVVMTLYGASFLDDGDLESRPATRVIQPNQRLHGFIMFSQGVSNWANYDPNRDEYDPAGSVIISCETGVHRTANQSWRVVARGNPFRRDPHDDDYLVLETVGTLLYCTTEYMGSSLQEPPT